MTATMLMFLQELLAYIAEFLMTEPINYFTGITVFLYVMVLVKRIVK